MANHKSALKRVRHSENVRVQNKYFAKTTRNAIVKLKTITDKADASELLKKVSAMIDKLAKKNIIHKNKAANLKSQLTLKVNKL
ncbi:MAG: 30S ribosomal protein S20 [Bacteroidota bacterium]|nr:30S ribosomal protein S20 [Bacteroidota bacterium]